MELFDGYLLEILRDLHPKDLLIVHGLLKKKHIKKNEIYLEEGKHYTKIFYVKKGLLRGFYTDENGEEKTTFIRWEKDFGTDPGSFFEKKPTRLTWEALEDTVILEIDLTKAEELSKRNHGILNIRLNLKKQLMMKMYERIEHFIIFNPEQRFAKLKELHPDLCKRVPDKHLASYLGITPVSLSRIRKRLFIIN